MSKPVKKITLVIGRDEVEFNVGQRPEPAPVSPYNAVVAEIALYPELFQVQIWYDDGVMQQYNNFPWFLDPEYFAEWAKQCEDAKKI